MEENEFLTIVVKNHPLVKKSELITRKGDLNVMQARGGFDPYLYNYFSEKNFNEKKYYSIMSGGLKIPTWYGIEGKLNYDNTAGYYLNPENNMPTDGLISAGISASIGKGLFMDERRKTLQKAKVYDDLSEIDQFLEINTILYEGIKTYWDWVIAYNHLSIYKNSVKLANIRFEGVKKNFYQGAEPAIDTLEAYIQLQNRIFSFNEAQLEVANARLRLSNFLWSENLEPLVISDSLAAPEILDEFHNYIKSDHDIEVYVDFDVMKHPMYQAYDLKLTSLDIERKYRAEALKPKLDISYNFLREPLSDELFSGISQENYKLGLTFSVPLLFREQRGAFQQTKVNIQETQYMQLQKAREIDNKITYYIMEIQNLEIQEKIFTKNTVNYERLLDAEKRKFDIGESSLFLINSRENKVIESQIKLIDLRGKYQKSTASLKYTAGSTLIE